MTSLFDPLTIRSVQLRNRIGMPPMCQYQARDGLVNDWHTVHYGSRAVGGAGLIILEATAVEPAGRISPNDLGIWDDALIGGLRGLAGVIKAGGAAPAIQIAHAGRKAGTAAPFQGGGPLSPGSGGWQVVGPSDLAFSKESPRPHALSEKEIASAQDLFAAAAARACQAGFEILELHAAHGYLISSFLSPLANRRTDGYGGDLGGRTRFLVETVRIFIDGGPQMWFSGPGPKVLRDI